MSKDNLPKIKEIQNRKNDSDSSEIIYNEVLRQFEIDSKSLDSSRNRANSIIGFSGVIFNLVLLSSVQIIKSQNTTPYLLFLLVSAFFIFLSIILALPSIWVKRIPTTDPNALINDFKDETKRKTFLSLSSSISESSTLLAKKIKKMNMFLEYSLLCLITGVFFLLIFLISYVNSNISL